MRICSPILSLAFLNACASGAPPKDEDLDVAVGTPTGSEDAGTTGTSDGTTDDSGDDAGDDGGTVSTTVTGDRLGLPDCSASEGHATAIDRIGASTTGTLDMTVSYSGGCEAHYFELCWPDGSFADGDPATVHLELLHTGTPDRCEAYVTENLELDVSPMADAYAEAYGSPSGELILLIHGTPVFYTF